MQPNALNGHVYMMVNLFPFGSGFAGQMSAQLSEGRGGKFSGFTEGGVSLTPPLLIVCRFFILRLTDSLFFVGEALETWATQAVPTKGKSKMFWGCFSWGRRTDLVVMAGDPDSPRGGVTAKRYIETLEEYLPTILNPNSIFMYDNASIHTAYIVRDWFCDEGIELLDWPPYSPDLNPIENLWKRLKDEIIRAHPELVTMGNSDSAMDHLIECAKEAWETLAEEMLNKLASEMQKRVDAVLKANGWYTKY